MLTCKLCNGTGKVKGHYEEIIVYLAEFGIAYKDKKFTETEELKDCPECLHQNKPKTSTTKPIERHQEAI